MAEKKTREELEQRPFTVFAVSDGKAWFLTYKNGLPVGPERFANVFAALAEARRRWPTGKLVANNGWRTLRRTT